MSLSERLRQSSGTANKSKDAHLSVKCFKLRQLVGASNIPTGRTLAVLSCYQAVDVLCLAGPALSFANCDQAKIGKCNPRADFPAALVPSMR